MCVLQVSVSNQPLQEQEVWSWTSVIVEADWERMLKILIASRVAQVQLLREMLAGLILKEEINLSQPQLHALGLEIPQKQIGMLQELC
jgi:hypothetical protein